MAHKDYYDEDGNKLDSVTSVLGEDIGGLMYWSNRLGLEGIKQEDELKRTGKIGDYAHSMYEAYIKKLPQPEIPSMRDMEPDASLELWNSWNMALVSYEGFTHWHERSKLEFVESEIRLQCKCHKLGGMIDTVTSFEGKLGIGDFKTSNSVRYKYMCQIAAYKHLWEVNFPDRPIVDGCYLFRFGKDKPGFDHRYWKDLDLAWEVFLSIRNNHPKIKKLKKLL